MKKNELVYGGVLIALLYLLAGMAHAQYEDYYADRGSSFISINTYGSSEIKNSFTGSGSAMDAYLYRIQINYYPAYDAKTSGQNIHFTSIAFELSGLSDITPTSAGEMRLVMDTNGNEKPDADDKVVARSTIDFAQAAIFFKFDEPIRFTQAIAFFLVGDFPSLVAHADMRVKLSNRFVLIEDREEGKLIRVMTATNAEVWHHEGNSAPTLDYSYHLKDGKNGVTPVGGRSGDVFTFEVTYTDRDGDIAQGVEVWIDLNENGRFDMDERFVMQIPDPPVVAANQRYRLSMRIISSRSGQMMYRFFATDGKDEAVGNATEISYLRINNALAITDARVLSDTISDGVSDSVVPGEKFDVAYTVRYFFESVKVKWESVPGVDVSPFTFLGAVHKNRHPADLLYDEETLVISFRAPPTLTEGKMRIPVIGVQANWYDLADQTEKITEAFAPDISVSVVPLRAWMEVIASRAAPTIADEIHVVLTVVKRPDVKLVSSPEHEFTFPLSDEGARFSVSNKGNADVDKLIYTAVFHSTLAVGVLPRKRMITPLYKLEYRVAGDDVIHFIELSEQSVTFTPILTIKEAQGPALVFPRRAIAPEFRFGTEAMERVVTRAMYVCGALGMGAIVIPLVIFLWSAIYGGYWYRKTVARSAWKSHVRLMRRAGVSMSRDLLASAEQSFRRYLAYVYGCSEQKAQSVAMWEILETSPKVSTINTISIRVSLERFRALSEGRASEDDAVHLIEAQYGLWKFI